MKLIAYGGLLLFYLAFFAMFAVPAFLAIGHFLGEPIEKLLTHIIADAQKREKIHSILIALIAVCVTACIVLLILSGNPPEDDLPKSKYQWRAYGW